MRRVTWKDVVGLIAAALVIYAAYVWIESEVSQPLTSTLESVE